MKKILLGLTLILIISSCSPYQKLLKSTDYELKYTKGMEYYEKKDYLRASTLFEELVNIFRGSEKAEKITYAYADCLFQMKDYIMAQHYYQVYVKDFIGNEKVEKAQFMNGLCYYLLSARPRLDQEDTYNALTEFSIYLSTYPNGYAVAETVLKMKELRDKLVYKSYLNCKLYYNLGDYGGNNYLSAVIAAQNSLREFPDTKYREELSFLILDAKYRQAINSIEAKKDERLRDCLDEYYAFINEFPQSTYLKKSKKIYEDTTALLN